MSYLPPLFEAYPAFSREIAHIRLGTLPTPIESLDRLAAESGLSKLYIKRDDVSGPEYGGNKVRKLEFVLAQALREKRTVVVTTGAAGSNHALATAIYAKRVGLRCSLLLRHQPNNRGVARNLSAAHQAGASLHHFTGDRSFRLGIWRERLQCMLRGEPQPFIIPLGGSSTLGTLGFVNAAFELRDQIAAGLLSAPDVIYVAMGTMGTTTGLALGLHAAGLKTRVIAVRVVAPFVANDQKYRELYAQTASLLQRIDPNFPSQDAAENLEIRHDFFGTQYALFTPEGMQALARIKATEKIHLEGTYTGKTLAALLADAGTGQLDGRTVMFWNTYNSRDLSARIDGVDYHELPSPFHRYFEMPVQPLDQAASTQGGIDIA